MEIDFLCYLLKIILLNMFTYTILSGYVIPAESTVISVGFVVTRQ